MRCRRRCPLCAARRKVPVLLVNSIRLRISVIFSAGVEGSRRFFFLRKIHNVSLIFPAWVFRGKLSLMEICIFFPGDFSKLRISHQKVIQLELEGW